MKRNRVIIIPLSVITALFVITVLRLGTFSDYNSEEKTVPARSDAMNALNFWSDQRAYPAVVMPDAGYYKAFEYSNIRLDKGEKGLNPHDTWESIGPRNRGGRTNAIAVDPQNPDVIYAGAASGGLWRLTFTAEDQYSWEYIDTGFPVLGVNAIGIDPRDSDVIYIGTGEVYGYQSSIGGLYIRTTRGSYGIGLLKTTDRGATWTKSIDWAYNQQRGVLAIEINPLNPDVIFAGTSEGTYKSVNAGETWTKIHSTLMAVDVAINPVDTSIVYVSCGNLDSPGSGIYKSIDGGGTWTKLGGGLPSSWSGKTLLAIYKSSPNILYADVANDFNTKGLYRSENHGITWTQVMDLFVDYATYQGWFSHYVRVNPVDDSKLLIGGVNFYYSNDGGVTVTKKGGMHVDHHAYAEHPTNPNIVYFANDGGVYRTKDGGASFQMLNDGYVTAQFYNGFSSSATNPDLAIGGLQDNGTYFYKGTPQWEVSGLGGDGCYTAINPLNDLIIFGSSQYLSIRRSTNRGQDWAIIGETIDRSNSNNVCFVAPYELSPSHPWIMYAGTHKIYKSENLGSNWAELNSDVPLNGNPILSIGISHSNPDVVYAATTPKSSQRAEVFKSTNGGVTWNNITGSLPDRYYVDFKVSPHDDQVAYITLSGFGSSHLYRTKNGGDSWDDIGNGLPDVPTSAVAIDPQYPNHIYVGNDVGVYVSTDYGSSWQTFTEGMPTAVLVMDLSISPSNRKIRGVTHGNGVYERSLLSSVVTVEEKYNTYGTYELLPNYPNPFNPETNIEFILPEPSFVTLKIYNLLGQEVRTLIANGYPAGQFKSTWNGKDNFGKPVASGTYIYVLQAGDFTKKAKMTLLR